MKLIEVKNWNVKICGIIKCTTPDTNMKGAFPLDIGALSLKSQDGKRKFILDSYQTEYSVDENLNIIFRSYLSVDQDTFEDCPFDLLKEDLANVNAEFYCSTAEESNGEYQTDEAIFEVIFQFQNEPEFTIYATQEDCLQIFVNAVVKQMDEWTLAELFDYHKDQELLDSDEDVNDFLNDRPDLLQEAKDHRRELLEAMSVQEVLDRYKRFFV